MDKETELINENTPSIIHDANNKEHRIKMANLNTADNASLTYFTNPAYIAILEKRKALNVHDNSEEIKFYKKRITSLFKDILREEKDTNDTNESVNMEIKEFHSMFVNAAIRHFQMIDTKDIIQGQHPRNDKEKLDDQTNTIPSNEENENKSPEDLLNTIGGKELFTIDEANCHMMRKTITVSNLDNYVTTNKANTPNDKRIIPLKLDIDLKSNDLKKKGVKTKNKDKDKNKDKSKFKKEDLSNEIV
jgi:hypothetical protein